MNEQSPSQKSQVSPWFFFFFLNCDNTQCEQKERRREKGIEFSFVGEQSGRERKTVLAFGPVKETREKDSPR